MNTHDILSMPICPLVWVNNAKAQEWVHCSTECAWYDHDCQQCAMLTVAKYIRKEAMKK